MKIFRLLFLTILLSNCTQILKQPEEENVAEKQNSTTIQIDIPTDESEEAAELIDTTLLPTNAEGHLTFKGIAINGPLKDFVAQLKKAGFADAEKEYWEKDDRGTVKLCGDFAGYKNCIVKVYALQSLNCVSRIEVTFPPRDEWNDLVGDYTHLRSLLTKKYGRATSVVEKFQGDTPTDNLSKKLKLKLDECTWQTIFRTKKGTIKVFIKSNRNNSTCYVGMKYFDTINSARVNSSAIDDL